MISASAFLITNSHILSTDIYYGNAALPKNKGKELIISLNELDCEDDFIETVHSFNEKHFGYRLFKLHRWALSQYISVDRSYRNDDFIYSGNRPMYTAIHSDTYYVDFNQDYQERFGTDYLYFKNLLADDMLFSLRYGNGYFYLKSGEACVIYLGAQIVWKSSLNIFSLFDKKRFDIVLI